MGTCFGRYSCSCCNCLYLKQPWSSSSSSSATTIRSSVMARQSSTLEFENFMYDCDLQEPSTLRLQQHSNTNYHQQPSISTVVRFDSHNVKLDNFKWPVHSDDNDGGKLMLNDGVNCDNYDKRRGESPLLDPILLNINERITSTSSSSSSPSTVVGGGGGAIEGGGGGNHLLKSTVNSKNVMMMMMRMGMRRQRRKENIEVNCCPNYKGKMANLDSEDSDNKLIAPSMAINQPHNPMMMKPISKKVDHMDDDDCDEQSTNCWDHEVNSDGLINAAGNDLEWDDYQDNLIFTDETDSLIQDIEDLTAKALKETGLN